MTEHGRDLDAILRSTSSWGATHSAVAVLGRTGLVGRLGDPERVFRWASVTKLLTAWATHIAVERGIVRLDEPVGPPGSTLRHLLAHTSGWSFDGTAVLAAPGTRRIYSNTGYDRLGGVIEERTGRSFEAVLGEWVLGPLGMSSTSLLERPSQGLHGSLADLERFTAELRRPRLISEATARLATAVAFPGIKGVVPGVGNYDPCDWGLGPELRDGKDPHWMGRANSPATFGHFGGSGTFVWVDPAAGLALAVLTDREFGPWSLEAWPPFSDAVLATLGIGAGR